MDIESTLAAIVPPIYDFLFDLVVDPECRARDRVSGVEADYDWFDFGQAELEKLAREWADDERLGIESREELLAWVAGLPWEDGRITFVWGEDDETEGQPGVTIGG